MERITGRLQTELNRIKNLVWWRQLKDLIFIALGVGAAAVGLKGFLLPNHFLDGGVTGISLLTNAVSGIDLSLLIIAINLPFLWIGYKQFSPWFALKSLAAITALSVTVHYVEFQPVTEDKLLIAVFGGFFLGAGIGFSMRGSAVIDGTEILAVAVSRRTTLSVGDFIAVFNVVLFGIAIFVTGAEVAMYSMLTYFAASRTVDFLINGIEEYLGVTVISPHADDIAQMIMHDMGRGITIYKSEPAFVKDNNQADRKVIFCVITRLEVTKLLLEIEKIDPGAFVIQHSIKDTKGGMIRKRPLH